MGLMIELRISDGELQQLIAPAILKRLKKAGFRNGTPSDDMCTFFLPVNLNLAGRVKVTRHEDGTWLIQQETDDMLIERTDTCAGLNFAAFMQRDQPSKGD